MAEAAWARDEQVVEDEATLFAAAQVSAGLAFSRCPDMISHVYDTNVEVESKTGMDIAFKTLLNGKRDAGGKAKETFEEEECNRRDEVAKRKDSEEMSFKVTKKRGKEVDDRQVSRFCLN